MYIINFSDQEFDLQPKKNTSKKYNLRVALVVLIFLGFIFGLLLVLRGYFLENPPKNDLKTYIYNQNQTEPKSLSIVNSAKNELFGETITSPFTKVESESEIFIQVKTLQNIYIGSLNKNNTPNWLYKLPSDVGSAMLFQDNSLMYFVNNRRGQYPRLVYVNNFEHILKELEFGEYFVSAYFEPNSKTFYYSYINIEGNFVLRALKGDADFEIITSSTNLEDSKIIYIENNSFFFEQNKKCYTFSIDIKVINPLECNTIKYNDKGVLFSSNALSPISYPIGFKAVINKYDYSLQQSSQILERQLVNFSSLFYHNNNIIFLEDSINPVSLIRANTSLKKFDLLTSEEVLISSTIPSGIVKAAVINNIVYLITKSGNQYYLQYLGKSEITSAPQMEWIRLSLGVGEIVFLDFITQKYTI